MLYTDAFKQLGYVVELPRQDWSAAKTDGVCITLWEREVQFRPGPPHVDTRLHCGSHELWKDKPGNRKRIRHLMDAVSRLDGRVDVVMVRGNPGESCEDAYPWMPRERRRHEWRITEFDAETGHFRAEAVPPGRLNPDEDRT